MREKGVEQQEKDKKNASEDDVKKLMEKIRTAHEENLAGGGAAQEAAEARLGMIRAPGANKWAGRNMEIGDVKRLVMDSDSGEEELDDEGKAHAKKKAKVGHKQEDDKEETEDEEYDDEGRTLKSDATSSKGDGKRPKKEPWFDRDKAVSRAERAASTWRSAQQKSAGKIRAHIAIIEDELNKEEALRGRVTNEWRILSNRRTALDNISLSSPQHKSLLKAYIADLGKEQEELRAARAGGHHGSGMSAVGTSGRDRLGRAPPCRLFLDLRTLKDLAETEENFHDCDSQDELRKVTEGMSKGRAAIVELFGQCAQAIKEIKGAMCAARKELEAEKKDQSKEEKRRRRKAKSDCDDLFEVAAEKGKHIQVHGCVAAPGSNSTVADPDLAEPIIIKVLADSPILTMENNLTMQKVAKFQEKFPKMSERSDLGRTA